MPSPVDRSRVLRRGEGGDDTTAIDAAAEEVVVARLAALDEPFVLVSEELGIKRYGADPRAHVVVDPIDGSLNAKRGIPHFSHWTAWAAGPTRGDVFLVSVHGSSREKDLLAPPFGG